MKGEYTFVTLDNDMVTAGDPVFVDIDDSAVSSEMDFVQIDDSYSDIDAGIDIVDDNSDFIVMEDVDMMSDMDIDSYISDINEADVSIIL